MPKERGDRDCRVKIDHLNYIKYYINYIWGYSSLTEDSKTLTLVG